MYEITKEMIKGNKELIKAIKSNIISIDLQAVANALDGLNKSLQESIDALEGLTLENQGLMRINNALATKKTRGEAFIVHIENHLKQGDKVICKICGKTVDEIYNHDIKVVNKAFSEEPPHEI